ncbi:MAG: 2-oxo acid dehydrogenase subunit E2 [Flavobacteriaceae bacterium]|nr:2-oxo acid dehydrogenase subunit E2 [Flavobacteriaceae bacterium]
MAIVINMPRLSDTMTEGVVATWLKNVGDTVEEGDILAEIETDKATMEFESFNEGVLLYVGIQEGEAAPVDSLLAIIGEEGEDISALISGGITEVKEEETNVTSSAVESSSVVEMPEGVIVVTMPRLSDTMTEGTVATWLKNVGDTVNEGDILAEIETDKATMEFESFNEGTLLYVGLQEGEAALVDSILAIIGPKGTDVANIAANYAKAEDAPKKEVAKAKTSKPVVVTKTESKVVEKKTSTSGERIFASPLAKKMAKDKGIALNRVSGSGENGRIIKKDIENYQPASSGVNLGVFVPSGEEKTEDVTNSQMRKVIARRLGESKFTAPHYYLNVEFDMENAIAFRKQFNSLPEVKISYNDIIVKASALALKQHPQVNSQWFDDHIQLNHHVHVGVAIAVEDGLVVPVVEFTNEKSLPQIGAEVKDYAVRARQKKLTPQEMDGSTFTISNLGMFGIESFTSIINAPNSAILSVGAIVEKPVVKDGQLVVGNTMKLTLACDHRTVDGATGAQFLQTLKGFIENPVTMLV